MKQPFLFLLKSKDYHHILPEQLRQWHTLQIFNIYRVCIAVILVVIYLNNIKQLSTGHAASLFLLVSGLYFIFSFLSLYVTYSQLWTVSIQTTIQVFVEITLFSMLIWTNQNFIFGVGILINASIAGGSLIMPGRISLLFAAYGSIAVLIQHVFSNPHAYFATTGYTETGILGATFFATAILSYGLSSRIRASEALASQRGVDLAKLEMVNALILQRMRSGVLVVDENDRVRFINHTAWYLLGIPLREGPQFINTLSPDLASKLRRWQENPTQYTAASHTTIAGQGIITQFTPIGTPVREKKFATLIFLEDAARMSQQAQQMKLASLGRLTASIAHEIRNPLSAISHAGQLLAETPNLGRKELRLTEIIKKQSQRMNEVIESVLQLSRRKKATPTVIKIKLWLEDFVHHFKMHLDGECVTTLYVDPEDLTTFADSTQLWQILNNLCENGFRYGQLNSVAELKIKASLNSNDEPYIEVIDNGPGVDPEIQDYIFEPFFTTKSGGTGLGLYIAKELCEANQSHLSYYPIEQGGSCFRITFQHPTLLNEE